jgi:hypothetical protein
MLIRSGKQSRPTIKPTPHAGPPQKQVSYEDRLSCFRLQAWEPASNVVPQDWRRVHKLLLLHTGGRTVSPSVEVDKYR